MPSVLLDTNFILTCIKEKIDMFDVLEGFEILIPQKVLNEIVVLAKTLKGKERRAAELAQTILTQKREKFTVLELPGRYADSAIVTYAKINPEIRIATLDQTLRKKIKNKIITIQDRKITI